MSRQPSSEDPLAPSGTDARLCSEGAAALVRLSEGHLTVERSTIVRTFHAANEALQGSIESLWWQIFSEASVEVGLRPSILDCSIEQASRLVDEGADLVLFGGSEPFGWAILRGRRDRHVSIWYASTGEQQTLKRGAAIRACLTQYAVDGRIRCVAYDWWDMSAVGSEGTGKHVQPLARLRNLLLPEMGDIWLVGVFAFVVGLLALATPIAVESLVNTVTFGRYLQPIIVLSILLFFFLAFSAAVTALQTYVVEIIQQRLFARVSADVANRLPRVSIEGTEGRNLAELVNRFFDVATVQKVTSTLLVDGISIVLTTVIGMVVLGFYHPFLLGFDIVLLASIVFLIFVLGRGAIKSAVKESKCKYEVAAWLEDVARCGTTFRSAIGKNLSTSRSDRLIQNYLVARKAHFRVVLRQTIFGLGLYALASTVLLGLGGWLVISGELTLGQLVAAELIVAVIVGAFAKSGKYIEDFYDLLAAVDKLGNLFDLPPERQGGILDSTDHQAASVEISGVTYSHKGGKRIGSVVNASVPAGASLAILGPSGSGKSSLIDLLYGSRRPSAGQILVNGNQPTDMQTDDYRSHVELVREGELFTGTIADNVHLQHPAVSGDDVHQALEEVGLISAVTALPDGLETQLSGSAAPLTGSQARLLLIARAIAVSPTLMLVDGLLDALSDEEIDPILDVLLSPDRPWTLVVATGRGSIADRCLGVVRLSTSEDARPGKRSLS